MPLLRKAFTPEKRSSLRRMPSVSGRVTAAGVTIDPERSLQIGAVYSCVSLLAEAIAGLPVIMFDRGRDGTRKPIEANPILSLVKDKPNPVIDAGELWRTVMGWMLLRGNAYVYIERNGAGQPIGLWPLSPNAVEPRRLLKGERAGQLVYACTIDEVEWAPIETGTVVQPANMLHYRAFGLGVEGLSPIGLARQSVGIAFAAQQYMGGFYARDASPGSHLEVEGELTDEQYDRLEAQWKSLHEGWQNAHRLAILEGGAKWASSTLSPKDAEFIATQKFTRGEIASIYGVPPHLIGDTEKSTSWGSGIAEQGIGFVTYSLRRWTNRLERVTRQLLTQPGERFRWNVDGLMQGDTKSRYDAYAVGKQWGWLSTNDIRRKEDEAPVEGGDAYLQPLNMVPAGSTTAPAARAARARHRRDATDDPPADTLAAWVARHTNLLQEVFEEQRDDVLAALRDGGAELDRDQWDQRLTQLLMGPAADVVREQGQRLASALGGDFDPALTAAYIAAAAAGQAIDLNISTQNAIDRAIEAADEADEDPVEHINAAFDEANDSRAPLVAAALVNRWGNFGRHEGAKQSGARTKTWRTTSANPRPAHQRMDGETVPVEEAFSNRAMYPHDPRAGADDTAGCKCTVEYSTEEP